MARKRRGGLQAAQSGWARSGWATAAVVTGAALGGGTFLAAAAVGVTASVMARTIVTPPREREDDVLVHAVDLDAGIITLGSNPDSVLPGEYSFWFSHDAGHARLGEITSSTCTTVKRRVLEVSFGDLARARRGRLSGWIFLGPGDLGFPFEDVLVPTELGDAPAWVIMAAVESDLWVIQVHGRGVRREEGLRAVAVFREAGYNSLLVSYRNDGDAPTSGDRRYGLGDTEWRDIDAALGYAVNRGATSVVLMGWSMGGAIVLQALTRSKHRHIIVGVVLESPVIDWGDVVAYQGRARGLPSQIAAGAMRVMGHRWGGVLTGQAAPIDFGRLDFVARADELGKPILLLHSDDDGFVPSAGSRALAARRPDIVTFVPFTVARHTKLWNHDPERWNGMIRQWLNALAPTWHTSTRTHPAATAEG